jgi:hypothetical protein
MKRAPVPDRNTQREEMAIVPDPPRESETLPGMQCWGASLVVGVLPGKLMPQAVSKPKDGREKQEYFSG